MKYEELINDLRHYSNVSITAAVGGLVSDAAGAIEDLQAEVERLKADVDAAYAH